LGGVGSLCLCIFFPLSVGFTPALFFLLSGKFRCLIAPSLPPSPTSYCWTISTPQLFVPGPFHPYLLEEQFSFLRSSRLPYSCTNITPLGVPFPLPRSEGGRCCRLCPLAALPVPPHTPFPLNVVLYRLSGLRFNLSQPLPYVPPPFPSLVVAGPHPLLAPRTHDFFFFFRTA